MIKTRNLVLLLGILILLAVTNPTKPEYVAWFKEKAMEKSNTMIEKGLVSMLGTQMIDNATQTKNFGVVTIYDTILNGRSMRVLGIFHNFLPLR